LVCVAFGQEFWFEHDDGINTVDTHELAGLYVDDYTIMIMH